MKNNSRRNSGYGTICLIVILLALAWNNILNSSANINKELTEQTAIAQAFNKAGTAIIVLDKDSEILYWDQSAVKLFGFISAEVLNQSVDIIVYEEGVADRVSQRLLENDPSVKIVVCEGVRKDGKIIPIAIRIYAPFQSDKILVLADKLRENTITQR